MNWFPNSCALLRLLLIVGCFWFPASIASSASLVGIVVGVVAMLPLSCSRVVSQWIPNTG